MSAAVNLHSNPYLMNELTIYLSYGVDETLQTMAHVSTVFEKSFNSQNWIPPVDYSVYLDIASPPSVGQIRFHFSLRALKELYKNMMQEEADPDIKMVVDCLGELSNVSYGLAKGKLNREGYLLGMALPHPGKTADLPAVKSDCSQVVIPFKIFNETCYIQIVIL